MSAVILKRPASNELAPSREAVLKEAPQHRGNNTRFGRFVEVCIRILNILAIIFFYASIAYLAFKNFTSDQDNDEPGTVENEKPNVVPGVFTTNPAEGNDSTSTSSPPTSEPQQECSDSDNLATPVVKPRGHEIMDKILDIIFLLFLTAILFIYYHKEVVEGLQGVLIAYKDIRGRQSGDL